MLIKSNVLEQEPEPLQLNVSRFASVELDSSETSTTDTPLLRKRAVAGAVTAVMRTRIEAENFMYDVYC